MTLLAIVVCCNLALNQCDILGELDRLYTDMDKCQSDLAAVVAIENAKLPLAGLFENDEQVVFGWCEPKDLPYDMK